MKNIFLLLAKHTRCVSSLWRMEFFNCSKTVCMMFKTKSAKSAVIPLLTLGGPSVKSVTHYKYLGFVLDTELSDDSHSKTTAIPILCSKQAASFFFPMFKRSTKCTFSFLLYVHVCITTMVKFQDIMHAEIACTL